MKKTLLLLVITLTVVINTARAAEDTNSTEMDKRIRELQKKSMNRRPSNIDRERRDAELDKLRGLSREERRAKMQEMREKKFKDTEAARLARAKNKGIAPSQANLDQPQSLEKLQKQLIQEDEKHLKRLARLNRIKVLATEENNTKTLDRVSKLIAKEQRRYANKRQRVQSHQKMLERLKAAEKRTKGPDKQVLTKEAIEQARKGNGLRPTNKPAPIQNK